MATLSGTRSATTVATPQNAMGGVQLVNYGAYAVAANPTAADIIQLFRVPDAAVVLDGCVRGDDMDTGAEALDINAGWAANATDSLDADGFGNLGVWTGDATTDVKPEAYNKFDFGGVLKDGPKAFTAGGGDTMIQLTVVAAATTFAAGDVWAYAHYINPFPVS